MTLDTTYQVNRSEEQQAALENDADETGDLAEANLHQFVEDKTNQSSSEGE